MKDIDYKKRYAELSDIFCERLKEALKKSGATQAELGKKLSKSQNAIHKWINKSGSLPNVITFFLVCEILEIDPNFFYDMNLDYKSAILDFKKDKEKEADSINELKSSIEEIKKHIYSNKENNIDIINNDFLLLNDHDKKIVLSLIKSLKKGDADE